MSLFADVESGNIAAVLTELQRLEKSLDSTFLPGEELHQAITAVNGSGKTLLHVAALTGRLDMVQLLLAWDVSIATRDSTGLKASDYAAQRARAADLNAERQRSFAQVAALLRTREAWQPAAAGFRFNKVIDMITKAIPAVEEGANKEKVLLLGRSGAGKSSFLNYANGTRYQLVTNPDSGKEELQRTGGGAEIALVGTTMSAQTLYPQVVPIANQPFAYCDLAGLVDNRGPEQRIVAASSTQMLTRLPGPVKAIAVVLDLPSFLPRGQEFRDTVLALSHIIHADPNLLNSCYFIITKAKSSVTVNGILRDYVNALLLVFQNEKRTRALTDEEDRLERVLLFMRANRQRILIPNVCDDGTSYAAIRDELARASARPANQFDFTSHDNSQQEFNSVLETVAREYNRRINRIEQEIPREITTAITEQRTEQANIDPWQAEIAAKRVMMEQAYDASAEKAQITGKEAEIVVNNNQIAAQTQIINDQTRTKAALSGELAILDSTTEVRLAGGEPASHHHNHESYRNNFLGIPFGPPRPVEGNSQHVVNFNAVYPLANIVPQRNHGDWRLEWSRGHTNIHGVYTFPRCLDCDGWLELYVYKRDINATRIAELRHLLAPCQPAIDAATAERTRLENSNNRLRDEIQACRTEIIQGLANVEIRNQRLTREIEEREAWINGRAVQEAHGDQPARPAIIGAITKRDAAIAKQAQLQREREDLNMELQVNRDLFTNVCKIIRILNIVNAIFERLLRDFPAPSAPLPTGTAAAAGASGLFASAATPAGGAATTIPAPTPVHP